MTKTTEVTPADLANIASAISIAVNADLMARPHGAAIWKRVLKQSGIDVQKDILPPTTEKNTTDE